MRSLLVSIASMLLVPSCGTPQSEPVDSVRGTPQPTYNRVAESIPKEELASLRDVQVQVVDAEGRAAAGVEVLALPARIDPLDMFEFLLAGRVGQVERWGTVWRTNAQGEVTIRARPGDSELIARDAKRWGTAIAWDVQEPVRIVLAPEESQRVVCVDSAGRPGKGSLIWLGVRDPDDQESQGGMLAWGAVVTAADGSIEVPHAQHWRALQRDGSNLQLAGFVLWSAEMVENRAMDFPAAGDGDARFEVSPSGFVDVRTEEELSRSIGLLRWLEAPPDVQEHYDAEDSDVEVPEFPISLPITTPLALPLGQKFEIVVEIDGFVDPRVAFDGPKVSGEQVHVVIPKAAQAALIRGRLVDENARVLAGARFDAWMERGSQRVEPEQDWLTADSNGAFALDFPPGIGGTLNIAVDRDVTEFGGGVIHFSLGGDADSPRAQPEPTRVSVERLTAGTIDVGDVVWRSDD